jgi:hypothetical protein
VQVHTTVAASILTTNAAAAFTVCASLVCCAAVPLDQVPLDCTAGCMLCSTDHWHITIMFHRLVCSSVSLLRHSTVLVSKHDKTATALRLVLQQAVLDSKNIYMCNRSVINAVVAHVHDIQNPSTDGSSPSTRSLDRDTYGWPLDGTHIPAGRPAGRPPVDVHWMPCGCAFAIVPAPLISGYKQTHALILNAANRARG